MMMRRWKAALFLFLLCGTPAHGELVERSAYKCIHPDGRIEFAGQAVQGAECTLLHRRLVDPEPPQPPPVTERVRPDRDTPDDARRENCEVARENLDVLRGGRPIATTAADGSLAPLSDEQRAAERERAARDVEYWCDPR
jgi:hypothetical protein